jgi:hypothetical protein
MSKFSKVGQPDFPDVNVRIAWAGERFADLIEGQYTVEEGWYIWNMIVGWSDLCSEHDRYQYNNMARIFQEYLKSLEE